MPQIEVNVTTQGLQLTVLADKFKPEIAQKLIERLTSIATLTMYAEAPYKTGRLANSIQKTVGDMTSSVGPTAPYTLYVTKGTAPHMIRPVNSKALAFKTSNGLVFSRLVHHPGTKPNPFIQRTLNIVTEDVQETFNDLWRENVEAQA
jgi:hypothetical protein